MKHAFNPTTPITFVQMPCFDGKRGQLFSSQNLHAGEGDAHKRRCVAFGAGIAVCMKALPFVSTQAANDVPKAVAIEAPCGGAAVLLVAVLATC